MWHSTYIQYEIQYVYEHIFLLNVLYAWSGSQRIENIEDYTKRIYQRYRWFIVDVLSDEQLSIRNEINIKKGLKRW